MPGPESDLIQLERAFITVKNRYPEIIISGIYTGHYLTIGQSGNIGFTTDPRWHNPERISPPPAVVGKFI
jgi:hypothetical protein